MGIIFGSPEATAVLEASAKLLERERQEAERASWHSYEVYCSLRWNHLVTVEAPNAETAREFAVREALSELGDAAEDDFAVGPAKDVTERA